MVSQKRNKQKETIEPGMVVEASRGDLGEEDVSKPRVTEVVEDQQGEVEKIIVKKGIIFKKTLEIPADRIESIEQEPGQYESIPGKVTVEVSKKEAEELTSVGAEELAPEQQELLDKVEQDIPTAEGLREREASNRSTQDQASAQAVYEDATILQEANLS